MAAAGKFMLVLFVDDIGQQKSVDIVPAAWVSYDEEKDHLVTPFISNCSKINLRILKDLVQSEGEPLQSWDLHRIVVRGSATSYAEAEKKIEILATESYAFTTDTVEHAKEREHAITKKYKLKGNKYTEQDVEELFETSEFVAHNQTKKPPSKSTNAKTGKRNILEKEKKTNSSKKKVLSCKTSTNVQPPSARYGLSDKPKKISQTNTLIEKLNNERPQSEDDASVECDDDRSIYAPDDESDESTRVQLDNTRRYATKESNFAEGLVSNHVRRDGNNNGVNRGLTPRRDLTPRREFHARASSEERSTKVAAKKSTEADDDNQPRKTGNFNIPTGALDVADSDDTRTVVLKCYRRLSARIGQLQAQLADVKIRQTEMISVTSELSTKRIQQTTGLDHTIDKYSLGQLPFKALEQFQEFDTKLKSNKSIRNEITNGLTALVNSDMKYLSKSVRDIFQRIMTRDVLLNFTAVRQSGAKLVFKQETTLYVCMRDAILSRCDITEKSIHDAIGMVINNAKDWDGHRQVRKANNKATAD